MCGSLWWGDISWNDYSLGLGLAAGYGFQVLSFLKCLVSMEALSLQSISIPVHCLGEPFLALSFTTTITTSVSRQVCRRKWFSSLFQCTLVADSLYLKASWKQPQWKMSVGLEEMPCASLSEGNDHVSPRSSSEQSILQRHLIGKWLATSTIT